MKKSGAEMLILSMMLLGSLVTSAETIKLDNYDVYYINSEHPIEPSGLTLKDGQLFTVCDDANSIFLLDFNNNNEVDASVFAEINVDELGALNLDLEGITTVEDEFFVVSEVHHKLVKHNNEASQWVPDLGSVYKDAFQAGLFQIYNAGLEAVVYLGNQKFLMAVEKQPRGLIEVQFDQNFNQILKQSNQLFNDSKHQLELERKPDLTGLFSFEGTLYALHRNAYLIHELYKDEHGIYQEGQSWSYEHIVKHPNYVYQDMKFGHAEGLAVDENYFYLIVDNNNNPNFKNPNDKRPILIRAKRK